MLLTLVSAQAHQGESSGLPAAATDRSALEVAIEAERPRFLPPQGVTGITVPHHLLAADLAARGFWAASANTYDRILLIAPDHFGKVKGHFAVAQQDLDTAFGTVSTDAVATASLLAQPDLFEVAVDVPDDHGITSVVPFIRYFFPETPVVAVVASVDAPPEAWERAAGALESIVTDRTLVVQSTDYSHYLPLSDSIRRDQESLASIAAQEPDVIGLLRQPDHMDSLAAQYIQLSLQKKRLGGKPVIVANRSSAEYGSTMDSTTSYLVTVFVKDPLGGSVLSYGDQQRVFLAGDTMLGRYVTPLLLDGRASRAIADTVLAITGRAPLILNLEGVLLDEPVVGAASGSHVMQSAAATPMLRRLNVIAAGLANNHSQDLGPAGFEKSRAILSRRGIVPLAHGEIRDLGAFRVLPLTFHRGRSEGLGSVKTPADLETLCAGDADPPLVALVHWGKQYTDTATEAQRDAAIRLNACGVSLVVGAHSHRASTRIESLAGGALQLIFSLGNFLFDQNSKHSSGALLEVRVFRQGTLASRLVPIPNLFELGTDHQEHTPHRFEPHSPSRNPIVAGRTKSK